MAEFERIEKVSYLRIFTHNINKRKFMISCCALSFLSYLYQVPGKHTEKRARRSYLQLNMN